MSAVHPVTSAASAPGVSMAAASTLPVLPALLKCCSRLQSVQHPAEALLEPTTQDPVSEQPRKRSVQHLQPVAAGLPCHLFAELRPLVVSCGSSLARVTVGLNPNP
jgi:hypothetical protein